MALTLTNVDRDDTIMLYYIILFFVNSDHCYWIIQYQWIGNVLTDTVHKKARFLGRDSTSRGGILKLLTFLKENSNYEVSKQNFQLCVLFANNSDNEQKFCG